MVQALSADAGAECDHPISSAVRAPRHKWGEKKIFPHKTERECQNGCGIVKVTRHEKDGFRDVPWTEFWRGVDQIEDAGTPACSGRAIALAAAE